MNYYIENDIKDRVNVSLVKQSKVGNKILGEVAGVHHQKIAIFDNNIIIGGANLSHNYFLNRRDRYMKFK
jgi:phosphatidylserine/phosphatidylglycerophosphate/cardiolipin synthase-like enzyme